MRCCFYILVLSLLYALSGTWSDVRAEDFPEVMIILDGSGSMQEDDATGQTKMAAAKHVLNTVIPELPPEVLVGFATYGHRHPKDCEDVEILVPPGSSDREALLLQAMAIQPRGMTPIALAVTHVVESLKNRPMETTVILVSDGKETCGGDPCEVVRSLKSSGIRFIMHVVGFNVTDEEKKQLTCIAEAGGGQYFGATDADSLLAALETMREGIAEKVEKAKTSVVKKATKLGKLQLHIPASALQSLAGIKISRKSDDKVIKDAEATGTDTTHPLLADEYRLTLCFANSNYYPPTEVLITDFQVTGGETTTLSLGAIVLNIADDLIDLTVDGVMVIDRKTNTTLMKTEPYGNDYYLYKPKAVPAGEYDLAFQYYRSPQESVIATNITVETGKETYVTLDSGFVLKKPASGGITGWDLVPSGTSEPLLAIRRGWDNEEPLWRRFIVPPGNYDLYLHVDGMDEPLPAGEGIEIKKGETLEFDSGM